MNMMKTLNSKLAAVSLAVTGLGLVSCDKKEPAASPVVPAITLPAVKLQASDFPRDTAFSPDNTSVNLVANGAGLMHYVSGKALKKAGELNSDSKICFAVVFPRETPGKATLIDDSTVRLGIGDKLVVFKDVTAFLEKCDPAVSGLTATSIEFASNRLKSLSLQEAEQISAENTAKAQQFKDKYFGGKFVNHKVKRGEDLHKIADMIMRSGSARIGGTDAYSVRESIVEAIKAANGLNKDGDIEAGKTIKVPGKLNIKDKDGIRAFKDEAIIEVLRCLRD